MLRKWVGTLGGFISLSHFNGSFKSRGKSFQSFKFNPQCLEHSNFLILIKSHWVPFSRDIRQSTTIQFETNLKKVKRFYLSWTYEKKIKKEKELKEVEEKMEGMLFQVPIGFTLKEHKS